MGKEPGINEVTLDKIVYALAGAFLATCVYALDWQREQDTLIQNSISQFQAQEKLNNQMIKFNEMMYQMEADRHAPDAVIMNNGDLEREDQPALSTE
jgi:hypothetical protein